MQNIKFILSVIASAVILSGCGDAKNTADAPKEATAEHGAHENANTATLTAEQMKSIKIELGTIEKKQLTASLKANGLLRVPNGSRANATALWGGVIKSLLIQTGNSVAKGQTIATISNTTIITMQEDYLTTSANLLLAQQEFERQTTLKDGNATALKNLQQASANLNALKAKKASLQKQLNLIGISTQNLTSDNIQSTISIKSPIFGTVSNINVNIGSFADANTSIAEIVDNGQLHLDLYVYEKDLNKLRVGQTIHFTVTNNPGKEYDADVYAISNTFEPNTKAIAVHASVKGNKQGLIDGMNITALVSLENTTVDAVPSEAIVSQDGQDYIFIVSDAHAETEHHETEENGDHDEQGHQHKEAKAPAQNQDITLFEKIPVRKGTTDIGYSEVTLLKEVAPNAKIVTKGAFFILAKITNQGESHEH